MPPRAKLGSSAISYRFTALMRCSEAMGFLLLSTDWKSRRRPGLVSSSSSMVRRASGCDKV